MYLKNSNQFVVFLKGYDQINRMSCQIFLSRFVSFGESQSQSTQTKSLPKKKILKIYINLYYFEHIDIFFL